MLVWLDFSPTCSLLLHISNQVQFGSLICSLLLQRKFISVSHITKDFAVLRQVFLNTFLNLTYKTVKHFCHLTLTEKKKKHHIKSGIMIVSSSSQLLPFTLQSAKDSIRYPQISITRILYS